MKLPFTKRSGFTLIELMVVVSIIGLLSGLSLVGYNRFQDRQVIIQAANTLQQDLRLTQQRTLSGYKPTGWCNGATDSLVGWQLRFISTTTYQIEGLCSAGPASSPIKTVTMSTGVTRSGGDDTISFYSLPGDAQDRQINLTATFAGTRYDISVTSTAAGAIEISDITIN